MTTPKEVAAETPSRQRRFWTPRVAGVILALLSLAITEGALRLFNVGFDTSLTVPCTMRGRPAACYNLFFPAPFFPPGMIKTPQAYAIPADKSQGTFRIFVLGESAAMGDPDPAYGFSRYLEVMLRSRYPTMDFEIVNTGSVAINSHVLLQIIKGLESQQPDVFIIYSGNNEVVGPYGPGTALTASGMSLPVIRGSIFYHSTRIGQLLTKLGTQRREWGGMEMFLDKQVPSTSPLMKYVYSNYEANLRDTIAAARNSGARVIVATVATNLRDCAPFASLHREGLSPEDLHTWNALLEQGAGLENTRAYAEALQAYFSASKIDGQYAELEFRIARCLRALGENSKALEHFLRARDLDSLRFRADSRINDINRSVAKSSGADVVDADLAFAKAAPDGIPGAELVYEHVHLTPEGNYLLARMMFLDIAGKLTPAFRAEEVPSEGECEQLLALTSHDRTRVAREMFERLQRPPFTFQLNHSEQVLRLASAAEMREENPQQTAAEYQWSIRKDPNDRVLHYNYGRFLFDYNQDAAAEQFRMARAWDGFPVIGPDGNPY